jgi:hypothetical protein
VLNIIACGLIAVLGVGPQKFGLQRSGQVAMAFYWRCSGVLSRIALASLPASSCLVASVAPALLPSWPLKVRPVPRKRLPALRLHFARIPLGSSPALCCHPCHRHCAGIIALLRGRFCPCYAGIFFFIAFALPPAS